MIYNKILELGLKMAFCTVQSNIYLEQEGLGIVFSIYFSKLVLDSTAKFLSYFPLGLWFNFDIFIKNKS